MQLPTLQGPWGQVDGATSEVVSGWHNISAMVLVVDPTLPTRSSGRDPADTASPVPSIHPSVHSKEREIHRARSRRKHRRALPKSLRPRKKPKQPSVSVASFFVSDLRRRTPKSPLLLTPIRSLAKAPTGEGRRASEPSRASASSSSSDGRWERRRRVWSRRTRELRCGGIRRESPRSSTAAVRPRSSRARAPCCFFPCSSSRVEGWICPGSARSSSAPFARPDLSASCPRLPIVRR